MSGAGSSRFTNLQLRVMSAVVLAAVVLAVTWAGGLAFKVLSVVIAFAILFEWSTMLKRAGNATGRSLAALALLVSMLALLTGYSAETVLLLVFCGAAITFAFGIVRGEGGEIGVSLAYAGFSGAALAFLRGNDTSGLWAVLFLFATVWATDILAYFVGRALGGPKLAPSISPGKTWSGAIGGTVGGVIGGCAVALAAGVPMAMLGVTALVMSVLSQIGDLFESGVKRRHGVKDSGNLIPGHGGVMDRVDGLVAAAIALYLIGTVLGGMDAPSRGLFPI